MKLLRLFTLSLLGLTVNLLFSSTVTQAEDILKATGAKTQPSQSGAFVYFVDDRLTVMARDVSVHELLLEIAHQTGLTVVLSDPLEDRISVAFHRLSLDEGLRRILRHQNFALEYVQQNPEERQSTAPKPKELWIFRKGGKGRRVQTKVITDTKARYSQQDMALDSRVLRMALTSQDSWDREEAVEALGESGHPEAVAPLKLALQDENKEVREAAIDALADIGGAAAAQAVAIALRDEDASIREEAIEALGEIGGVEAAQALAFALKDEDSSIREEAVEALGKIGGAKALQALANALRDEDSWIREEAVDALGKIGGERAARLLEQALADNDESVRSAAAKMLDRLRNQIR